MEACNGENIRKYITDKYLRANTYLSTKLKDSEQVGYFNDIYSVMEKAAERLYEGLLAKLSVEVDKQKIVQEEKGEEKGEEMEEIDALHLFDDDEFEDKQEKKKEEKWKKMLKREEYRQR